MVALRRLLLPALAVMAGLLAPINAARAYDYKFNNNTGDYVIYINMHTVSVFCHDVSWSGRLKPGAILELSSASICLVDGVYVRTVRGDVFKWDSAIGVAFGAFNCCRNG